MSLPRDWSILFIFSKNNFIVLFFCFFCLLTCLLYGLCNAEGCLQFGRSRFISWVGKIHWRRDRLPTPVFLDFPCGSGRKESTCNSGDLDSIPGLGWSPGEENGYPLQYSGLENSMESQRVRHNWVTFTFMVSILFISSLISIIIITSFCYFWSFFFF